MEDDRKIFSVEIEVPDIVKQKADDAFAKIKMEGAKQMKSTQKHNNTTKNKKNIFRSQAAAVVVICLISAMIITILIRCVLLLIMITLPKYGINIRDMK